MSGYRAVVKYPIDATEDDKRKALEEGIAACAMQLVGEHELGIEGLEGIWEDALSDAALEIEMRA